MDSMDHLPSTSFDPRATYELEDDIVRVRPLRRDDHEHLLPFALQEPELWTYSTVQAIGADGLHAYLEHALSGRTAGTSYPFIVFDKRTGEYAGSTRFYDIQPNNASLQLGYTWYGKRFQRTGLNTRCKYQLLSLAFESLGMFRVEFRADHRNKGSIAAMKSIGCTVEGVLRQNGVMPDGSRRDSIVLSILRDEWFGETKRRLEKKMKG